MCESAQYNCNIMYITHKLCPMFYYFPYCVHYIEDYNSYYPKITEKIVLSWLIKMIWYVTSVLVASLPYWLK